MHLDLSGTRSLDAEELPHTIAALRSIVLDGEEWVRKTF
jgi:hypothetical protein